MAKLMIDEQMSVESFQALAFERSRHLGEQLLLKGQRLVLAESCTGGLLSASVTAIAGASQWFEAGLVVYANQAKTQLLGVPESLLADEGAVSEAVVKALVLGCFKHTSGHVAASISGIAGPDGGTKTKPVGTVWFGFAERDASVFARSQHFNGDRQAVQRQAVIYALDQLIALVEGD